MAHTHRRTQTTTHTSESTGEDLLELVARRTEEQRHIDGIVIGTLAAVSTSGEPRVDFPGNVSSRALRARSTTPLLPKHVGRDVALLFEGGDVRKPIVVGVMEQPSAPADHAAGAPRDVELDGERVVLTGQKEVVLRCGRSSITLTRAGKVIIRGEYVVTHAAGVNRIKGGSVQIN